MTKTSLFARSTCDAHGFGRHFVVTDGLQRQTLPPPEEGVGDGEHDDHQCESSPVRVQIAIDRIRCDRRDASTTAEPQRFEPDHDLPDDLGDDPGADREVPSAESERQERDRERDTGDDDGHDDDAHISVYTQVVEDEHSVCAQPDVGLLADGDHPGIAREQVPGAREHDQVEQLYPLRCDARGQEVRSESDDQDTGDHDGARYQSTALVAIDLDAGELSLDGHAATFPRMIPEGRTTRTARKTRLPTRRGSSGLICPARV